jgi:enamine deaminase RidA (YjgF/YER057c/UK114 family)
MDDYLGKLTRKISWTEGATSDCRPNRSWQISRRPNPPAITAAIAIGLARPEFLVEIDAVAVVAE